MDACHSEGGEAEAKNPSPTSPVACHSERSEAESKNPSPTFPVACCPLPVAPRFAVIDAIGLFESGLAEHCDLTAAVIADPELRVRRLVARDGISEDYARARIAAQKPMEWYAARADLLLENNGDEADFSDRCQRVFGPYLDRAFNSTEGAEGCGETGQ